MRSALPGSGRWARLAASAALLLTAAACGGGGGCGTGAMADTAGWRVVDAGPFVFKVPPDYREEHVQGVDSYIGRWVQGGRSVDFDFGPYTSDPRLRRGPDPRGRVCTARIDGREVAVVETEHTDHGRRKRYTILGWWQGGPAPHDTVAGQPHLRFHASAAADDREGRAEARTIVRSVRIRTQWTEEDRLRDRHRQCRDLRAYLRRQPPTSAFDQDLRRCPTGPPPAPPDYESVR